MELEKEEHCLICCSEIHPTVLPGLPTSTPYSCLLDKHLEVIFLLRKVLEVPVAQLAKYLEGCPNVEGWIRVCGSCAEAVNQCKLIYQEVLEANRKWRECQQEIVNVIKATKDEKFGPNPEPSDPARLVDISHNTRLFVKIHEYKEWIDPFVAGDLKAAEELDKFRSNSVVRASVKSESDPDNPSVRCPSPDHDNPQCSSDNEYCPDIEEKSDSEAADEEYDPRSHTSVKKKNADAKAKRKRPKKRQREMTEEALTLARIQRRTTRKTHPYEQPVDCHICGRRMANKRTLTKHLYTKHSIGTLKFQCSCCQRMFPYECDLKQHMSTVCLKLNDPTPKKLHTDEYFMPPGNHFRIKCPVSGCPLHWPIVSAYRNHLQSQHTPEERASVDKYPKILECLTCGKLVRKKDEAKVHLFSHDETLRKENEVVCEVCGATVQGKVQLAAHKKNSLQCRLLQGQSEAEATVVCDICGRRVSNQRLLQRHLQVVHHKNFKHNCERCEKGFMGPKALKVHLASAHGVVKDKKLELKCPVEGCGKIFYHKKSWRDHQVGVHKQGEPGYKCQECGKAFYTGRSLSQHVNVVHRGRRHKPKTQREPGSLKGVNNSHVVN